MSCSRDNTDLAEAGWEILVVPFFHSVTAQLSGIRGPEWELQLSQESSKWAVGFLAELVCFRSPDLHAKVAYVLLSCFRDPSTWVSLGSHRVRGEE